MIDYTFNKVSSGSWANLDSSSKSFLKQTSGFLDGLIKRGFSKEVIELCVAELGVYKVEEALARLYAVDQISLQSLTQYYLENEGGLIINPFKLIMPSEKDSFISLIIRERWKRSKGKKAISSIKTDLKLADNIEYVLNSVPAGVLKKLTEEKNQDD